jgi:hypothetical protein
MIEATMCSAYERFPAIVDTSLPSTEMNCNASDSYLSMQLSLQLHRNDTIPAIVTSLSTRYFLMRQISDITLESDSKDPIVCDNDNSSASRAASRYHCRKETKIFPSTSKTCHESEHIKELTIPSDTSSRIGSSIDNVFRCFPAKDPRPRMPIRQDSFKYLEVVRIGGNLQQ